MSFYLHFRLAPGSRGHSMDAYQRYFEQRPHYLVNEEGAFYDNPSTLVYFSFNFAPPPPDLPGGTRDVIPFYLRINAVRPYPFIYEAEPEVGAFVSHFGLHVHDVGKYGLGIGSYDPAKLTEAWHRLNAWAHHQLATGDPRVLAQFPALPAQVHDTAWWWNRFLPQTSDALTSVAYVPRVEFVRIGDRAATAVIWGDGCPFLLPEAELLLWRTDDNSQGFPWIPWSNLEAVLRACPHREGPLSSWEVFDPAAYEAITAMIDATDFHGPPAVLVAPDSVPVKELLR
jgi:hypothetical protein